MGIQPLGTTRYPSNTEKECPLNTYEKYPQSLELDQNDDEEDGKTDLSPQDPFLVIKENFENESSIYKFSSPSTIQVQHDRTGSPQKKLAIRQFISSIYYGLKTDCLLTSFERLQAIIHLVQVYAQSPTFIVNSLPNLGLDPVHKGVLALYLVRSGFSISRYMDKFSVLSERSRFELANEELDSPNIKEDTVSLNIRLFNLSNSEELIKIARKASKKGIEVAKYISYYNIPTEEERYNIFIRCLEYRQNNKLLEYAKNAQLTSIHRLTLAKKMLDDSLSMNFFHSLKKLNQNSSENLQVLIHATEKNHAFIYTQWQEIKQLNLIEDIKTFKVHNPLFKLNRSIKHLKTITDFNFPSILENYSNILSECHSLNKKCGIPFKLYRLTRKIAECCNGKELLQLAQLIRKNFFDKSIFLLGEVCERAVELYPSLQEYVLPTFYSYSSQYVPLLTSKGVSYILKDKLKKKKVDKIFTSDPINLSDLERYITDFQKSTCTKGYLIIEYELPSINHFVPLFIEKNNDQIKILVADSLSADETEGDDEEDEDIAVSILKRCELLTCKKELYFLSQQRQYDTFSCPIFTIKDISIAATIYSKNEQSFFEYIEKNSTIQSEAFNQISIKNVVVAPTAMMRLIQSLKKVSEIATCTFLKKDSEVSLEDDIEKNCFFLEKNSDKEIFFKKANLAACMTAARYFEKILQSTIETKILNTPDKAAN